MMIGGRPVRFAKPLLLWSDCNQGKAEKREDWMAVCSSPGSAHIAATGYASEPLV